MAASGGTWGKRGGAGTKGTRTFVSSGDLQIATNATGMSTSALRSNLRQGGAMANTILDGADARRTSSRLRAPRSNTSTSPQTRSTGSGANGGGSNNNAPQRRTRGTRANPLQGFNRAVGRQGGLGVRRQPATFNGKPYTKPAVGGPPFNPAGKYKQAGSVGAGAYKVRVYKVDNRFMTFNRFDFATGSHGTKKQAMQSAREQTRSIRDGIRNGIIRTSDQTGFRRRQPR